MSTYCICPVDLPFEVPNPDCPNADQHTPCPTGYTQWHEWAAQMSYRRSWQSRCPGCGEYAIWSTPVKPLPGAADAKT